MGKMVNLNTKDWQWIIALFEGQRHNIKEIAELIKTIPRSVYRVIKRHKECGTVDTAPRSGWPRTAFNRRTHNIHIKRVKQCPKRNWREMAASMGISESSVCHLAKTCGVKSDVGLACHRIN